MDTRRKQVPVEEIHINNKYSTSEYGGGNYDRRKPPGRLQRDLSPAATTSLIIHHGDPYTLKVLSRVENYCRAERSPSYPNSEPK